MYVFSCENVLIEINNKFERIHQQLKDFLLVLGSKSFPSNSEEETFELKENLHLKMTRHVTYISVYNLLCLLMNFLFIFVHNGRNIF